MEGRVLAGAVSRLRGALPDQDAQSGGQLLGSERGSHRYLDAFGGKQRGHPSGVDQHIAVGLVVAAPGAVAATLEAPPGLGTRVHAVPFQCSISGLGLVLPV